MDKYKQLIYFSFERLSSGFLIENKQLMKTSRRSSHENVHGAIAKIEELLEQLKIERRVEDDNSG